jgi:hypothetical protein
MAMPGMPWLKAQFILSQKDWAVFTPVFPPE